MIYKYFGDKIGLIEAVYEKKIHELADRLEDMEVTDDPVEDWYQRGREYWDFIYENRTLFDTFYSMDANRGFNTESRFQPHERIIDILKDPINRCVDAGILREDLDHDRMMETFWMLSVGNMVLTNAGYYSDKEAAKEARKDAIAHLFEAFSAHD
jgi:AcrR family transcriptional regulator